MKRLLAVGALLALIVPASAGAKPKHRSCKVKGANAVAAGSDVRVFSTRGKDGIQRTLACRTSDGKRYQLSAAEDFGSGNYTNSVQIAGSFVAYALQPYDDSQRYNPDFKGFPETIEVLDVATGKRGSAPAAAGASTSVRSLELNDKGTVAWLGQGTATEVHSMKFRTPARLLDSSSTIDMTSLAMAGNAVVYWINAGEPRFARL